MPSFNQFIIKPNSSLNITSNGTYDVTRNGIVNVNIAQVATTCILITSSMGATISCAGQTYTLSGSETSHAFIVQCGTYTCTATLNGTSKSELVAATSSGLYSINISLATYIYNNGTEYPSLTGALNNTIYYLSSEGMTAECTKNSDNIYMYTTGGYGCYGNARVATSNKIDLSQYRYLCASYIITYWASSPWQGQIILEVTNSWVSNIYTQSYPSFSPDWNQRNYNADGSGNNYPPYSSHDYNTLKTIKVDISDINSSYYIGIRTLGQLKINLKALWLE